MGKPTKSLRLGGCLLFAWTGATGAALGADVPAKAAPIAPAIYNWTGIYVGAHAGYGMGMKDWTNSVFDFDVKGFLGGGQVGLNQQIGNLLIGIEADASWANIKGTQTLLEGGPASGITSNRTGSSIADRLVTVAGRIGLAQDRWLVYFKGGAAWAHEKHTFNGVQTIAFGGTTLTGTTTIAGSENRFGPVIGFGAEYALWGNWSFKSEYNYLYLPNGTVRFAGQQTSIFGTSSFTTNLNIQQAFHLAKIGLNYRFGPETPPAIAPAPPAPGYNWTGFYIGAEGGYGFGTKLWEGLAPNGRFDIDGALAGVVSGTNVQVGAFVFGVESEWMWSTVDGGASFTRDLGFGGRQPTNLSSKIDWLSLASLRAGFVAADRWLVYVKGGVALARESHAIAAIQIVPGLGTATANLTGSALHTGYVAGVGTEYALFGNWSAKLEYNYVHFLTQDHTEVGPQLINTAFAAGTVGLATRARVLQELHLMKFGVNYRFGALPDLVTAKY